MNKVLFKYEGDYEFKPFSMPYESLIIYDMENDNLEYKRHNEVINKSIDKMDLEKIRSIINNNEELFNIKYYNVMGEDVTVKLWFYDKLVEIRDFKEYKSSGKMDKLLKVLDMINEILNKYDISICFGELPE